MKRPSINVRVGDIDLEEAVSIGVKHGMKFAQGHFKSREDMRESVKEELVDRLVSVKRIKVGGTK